MGGQERALQRADVCTENWNDGKELATGSTGEGHASRGTRKGKSSEVGMSWSEGRLVWLEYNEQEGEYQEMRGRGGHRLDCGGLLVHSKESGVHSKC